MPAIIDFFLKSHYYKAGNQEKVLVRPRVKTVTLPV